MLLLICGLVLFFAPHSISIVSHSTRNAIARKLGEGAYKGIYSLISLAGLLLIIKGYAVARLDPLILYIPPAPLKHISALLMLLVFPLLIATYLPGKIRATLKHPMLVATKLWAFSHLLANGMLADVILFGSFLIWAVADRISVKRRAPTPASDKHFNSIKLSHPSIINDIIAVTLGVALYVLFVLWAHKAWIGVAPFS